MSQSLFYSTLTPKGRGAIAVIAVGGPNVDQVIDACFAPAAKKNISAIEYDIIYGIWNSTGEDLLVIRLAKISWSFGQTLTSTRFSVMARRRSSMRLPKTSRVRVFLSCQLTRRSSMEVTLASRFDLKLNFY